MEIQQLLNVRDLLFLAFLAISGLLGAQRGLTRTFMGLLGRIVSTFGAGFAARLLAPTVARAVVSPIIGDLFEQDAADYLASVAGPFATAIAESAVITEMAAEMAEGVAFLLLLVVLGIFFSFALSMVSQSLRFLVRHTPLGIIDRAGGMALGLAGGAVMLILAAVILYNVMPELFRGLGWLSPVNTADTLLTRGFLEALLYDYGR